MKILLQRLLFVLTCLLAVTGCKNSSAGTSLSSINIVDRNGFSETICNAERLKQYEEVDFLREQPYQKVLRIHSRDAQGNVRAYITSYHPNGHPKQYLEVVNSRAFGAYREWHLNGTLKLETFVIGGVADIDTSAEQSWLLSGCSRAWDEKGNLVAEIPYKDGVLEGIAMYYHPNGNVWKHEPCHNGRVEGLYCVYLEDGSLFQTSEYVAGVKNGRSFRYWKEGVVAADETYCNGLLMTGCYFSLCGDPICKVENGDGFRAVFSKSCISEIQEYHQGVQDGEVKVFGSTGTLISLHHIRDGIKNGEEIEYYPPGESKREGQPMLSIRWSGGKIQGVVKTWYPDGTLESQREMVNNKKNGMYTAWYPDGSIMLVEEYDHGKLFKGEYFAAGERMPISQVITGKGVATLFDNEGNMLRKITYNSGKPLIE